MDIGLSGPFQRLDVLGFKKALKIAPQASDTVRQAITPLLLDRFTGCTDIQVKGLYSKILPSLGLVFMRLPACHRVHPVPYY